MNTTTDVYTDAHRRPAEEIVAALGSDAERGLTTGEANDRRGRYGPNELPPAPPVPACYRFLAQFQSPLTILLLVATAISFVA